MPLRAIPSPGTWGTAGTETTRQTYGEKLALPTQPLKDGYTFLGWFTDAEGGEQVTRETIFTGTGPATYYAHWELIPVFSVTVPVSLALTVSEQGRGIRRHRRGGGEPLHGGSPSDRG